MLEAYAVISHHGEHCGTEIAALLHRGEQVARPQQQLVDLFSDLLTEAAASGAIRRDVAAGELAGYCLHALTAASSLPSRAAVRRLITITLAGLRPLTPSAAGALVNRMRVVHGFAWISRRPALVSPGYVAIDQFRGNSEARVMKG